MGEIVVPEMDTPDNHRRLGELRAVELEQAMGELGVTEWENLGYRDSDMMGRVGNHDARCFWQADLDEAAGRLVWLVRTYQPDVITTYNEFGGYGHPDHIRTHDVAIRAFARAGDPAWYPEQLAPEHGGTGPAADAGGLAPWQPSKLYEQAIPASVRDADAAADGGARPDELLVTAGGRHARAARRVRGVRSEDARPRRVDHDLDRRLATPIDRKCGAIHAHVTQISGRQPVLAVRPRRLARVLGQGGLHPPRVAGRVLDARDGPVRRPVVGGAGATARQACSCRRAPARPDRASPGQQPLRRAEYLGQHHLAVAGGSRKFG